MNKLKTVIETYSESCGMCKAYEKTFDNVSNMECYSNIEFKKINLSNEENWDLIDRYGIRNVPSTLFLDNNGVLLMMLSGLQTEDKLIETINTLINNE